VEAEGGSRQLFKADVNILYIKKVKQSRNRPGVAQRVPERLGSQIS